MERPRARLLQPGADARACAHAGPDSVGDADPGAYPRSDAYTGGEPDAVSDAEAVPAGLEEERSVLTWGSGADGKSSST